MKRFAVIFIVLMTLSVTALPTLALEPGDKVDASFKTLDGKVVNSDTFKGRITILEFWATWCGPCVRSMPHMKKIYEEKSPMGVLLIGVSRDGDYNKMQNWLKEKGYHWPQVGDKASSDQLARMFGIRGIPHAGIIGPDGTLIWRGHPASIDKPLDEAIQKYRQVLAQTMRGQKDEPQPLDEATLSKARGQLDQAQAAMEASDFTKMLQSFQDIPEAALSDNGIRLRCRELIVSLKNLDAEQRKALNDARRSDIELAKAYGAVMRAAQQARNEAS